MRNAKWVIALVALMAMGADRGRCGGGDDTTAASDTATEATDTTATDTTATDTTAEDTTSSDDSGSAPPTTSSRLART